MYQDPSTLTPSNPRELTMAGAASIYDDVETEDRRCLRVFVPAVGKRFRYSGNPVRDGDFERVSLWVSDTEGAKLADQGKAGIGRFYGSSWIPRGTAADITLNKTAPQFGTRDIKLAQSQAEKVLNPSLDTWAAGAPSSWTEVDVGDGTIVEDVTNKNSGTSSADVNGGTTGIGTKITQSITITNDATKVYALRAFLRWVAGTATVRLVDTVNSKSLDSAGVWQAGITTAVFTQTSGGFTSNAIRFSPLAGATNLDIVVIAIANADRFNADDVSLVEIVSDLMQNLRFPLVKSRSYTLRFNHIASAANPNNFYYSLREYLDDGSGGVKWLQSGDTWATGEYWKAVAASATTVQTARAFTADDNKRYALAFTPGSVPAGNIKLDRVYIAEAALATDPELGNGIAEYYYVNGRGHVAIYTPSGTEKVTIAEML